MVYAEGVCFKHSGRWRHRLEWLMNQFRDKRKNEIAANQLKMEEFITSFLNLICSCNIDGQRKPHHKEINDECWREITENDYKASIVALKNYNVDPDMKRVVENLLKILYGQRVLSENRYEFGWKGAYRITYLVSKIIMNDFAMQRKYGEELARRTPKVWTYDLVDFPVVYFDALSDQIQRFNTENNCTVKLEKVTKAGTLVISATIKKLADAMNDLNVTFEHLKKLATETKEKAERVVVNASVSSLGSVTQQFVPLPTTQSFVPQAGMQDASTSTSNEQNLSVSYSSMEIVDDQGHSSMEVDTQSDICLVHSLAWMSTYQFVLNQIISRQILRGDYGHEFSIKICTCSNNNAQGNEDVSRHFSGEADILAKIGQVKDELKSWRNGIIVTQKLINEMEKEQSKSWQSLLKFVHHFLKLKKEEGNGKPSDHSSKCATS